IKFQCIFDEGLGVFKGVFPGLTKPLALIGVGQKGYMTVRMKVKGQSGHSSIPPAHTAIGLLSRAIARLEDHPMPARLSEVMRAMFYKISCDMSPIRKFLFSQLWLFGPLIKRRMTRTMQTNPF